METKFTPGPWSVTDLVDAARGTGFVAVNTDQRPSAHIAHIFPFGRQRGGYDRPLAEHRANAALIASAPALYEALYRLTTEAKLDGMDKRAGWDAWVSMADAALRAARGEQGEG